MEWFNCLNKDFKQNKLFSTLLNGFYTCCHLRFFNFVVQSDSTFL
jgi:hypothetical protein